ncbi:hypothetical protein AB6D04_10925 [Vibrio splendidus]|uniref:hypothetical protein n=1 Tax=Vibrio splendidus TaxID=29497 RepID=UPI000C85E704|nr:hypothetical protein [Vibrio splendidus]PMN78448.1 hypothetical protein BCT24_04500 [Vibrio splendidus]
MKKDKVLIISGVFWNAPYQRHHLNSELLVKKGFEVDFVEGCRVSKVTLPKIFTLLKSKLGKIKSRNSRLDGNVTPNNNFKILNSYLLPPGGKITRLINRVIYTLLMKRTLEENYDFVLVYAPTDLFEFLNKKNSTVIYDCVRAFSKWGGYHKSILEIESSIARRADYIFCDSFYIKDKYLCNYSNVIQLIPPFTSGINRFGERELIEIRSIGYFGSISEHVDIDVFSFLIESGYQVHFWGQVESGTLDRRVVDHGYVSNQEVLNSEIKKYCDGLIIPYSKPLDGVYPAKLSISFLTGLPIFTTLFYDSIVLDDLLYTYKSKNDLLNTICNFDFIDYEERKKIIQNYVSSNSVEEYESRFLSFFNKENK